MFSVLLPRDVRDAKRGITTICWPSVRLFVSPSVSDSDVLDSNVAHTIAESHSK